MTTRTKTVADYPPEFMQAWEQAAQGAMRISFPLRGSAINFRQRMYAFRKAFVRENGQAAIAHWFNNDLKIDFDDKGQKPVWVVTTGETDWKVQVRQASGASTQCQNVPKVHIGFDPAKPGSDTTVVEFTDNAPKEALESTLANLGFGTKPPQSGQGG